MSDLDKKDLRRQKLTDSQHKREKVSEEQKFVSKNKKQFKKQIQDLKEEELWEDWKNEIY